MNSSHYAQGSGIAKPVDLRLSRPGDGHPGYYLNPILVAAMGLDEARIEALKATHASLHIVREQMRSASSRDAALLLSLSRVHDGIEALQQEIWGFEVTPAHRRWFAVPHCSCHSGLNEALLSKPLRAVDECCPVHGQLLLPEPPVREVWPFELPSGHRLVRLDDSPQGRALAHLEVAVPVGAA